MEASVAVLTGELDSLIEKANGILAVKIAAERDTSEANTVCDNCAAEDGKGDSNEEEEYMD